MLERKARFVGVRFTAKEMEKLQRMANVKTDGNLSAALRRLVRDSRSVVPTATAQAERVKSNNRTECVLADNSAAVA